MEKKDSFGHGYCHGSHRGGHEENRGCRRERETERKRRHQNIYTYSVKTTENVKNAKFLGWGKEGPSTLAILITEDPTVLQCWSEL